MLTGADVDFPHHPQRALHSLKNKVEADRGLSGGRFRHRRNQSGSLRGTGSRSRSSVDLTGHDEPEEQEGTSDEEEDEDDSDFGSVITADEVRSMLA